MVSFFGFIKNIYVTTYKALDFNTDGVGILLAYIILLSTLILTSTLGTFCAIAGVLVIWILTEFLYIILPNITYRLCQLDFLFPDIRLLFNKDFKINRDIEVQRIPKESDMYVVYGAASIGWILAKLIG